MKKSRSWGNNKFFCLIGKKINPVRKLKCNLSASFKLTVKVYAKALEGFYKMETWVAMCTEDGHVWL